MFPLLLWIACSLLLSPPTVSCRVSCLLLEGLKPAACELLEGLRMPTPVPVPVPMFDLCRRTCKALMLESRPPLPIIEFSEWLIRYSTAEEFSRVWTTYLRRLMGNIYIERGTSDVRSATRKEGRKSRKSRKEVKEV